MTGPRRLAPRRPGDRTLRAVQLATLVTVLGVPLAVLVASAVSVRWTFPQVLPRELDLQLAIRVLAAPATERGLRTGALVSGLATVASLVLAWPAARALQVLPTRWRRRVAWVLFLPSLLPAVGLAMGVSTGMLRLGLRGGLLPVVLAHLVVTVPYAVAMLAAALARHDVRLEQQAASLGASPVQVFWHVTLPSVRAGVGAAAAFAFVVSWSQYLLTVLPGAGTVATPTTTLFTAASGGSPTVTATLALLVALPAAAAVGLFGGSAVPGVRASGATQRDPRAAAP